MTSKLVRNTAAIAGFAFCSLACNGSAEEIADTIYFGGPVLTMNDELPRAEAVAVRDGVVLAVGALTDLDGHKGDGTLMVDLEGRT